MSLSDNTTLKVIGSRFNRASEEINIKNYQTNL